MYNARLSRQPLLYAFINTHLHVHTCNSDAINNTNPNVTRLFPEKSIVFYVPISDYSHKDKIVLLWRLSYEYMMTHPSTEGIL